MSQRLVVATSLVACSGCSADSSSPAGAMVPLCDGSPQLTFRLFFASPIARAPFGSAVRIENGFPSFAVDGQCQYFMNAGWLVGERQTRDMEWRQGVLSGELRELVEAKGGAEDLRSVYECGSAILADASPAVIANARSSLVCWGGTTGRLSEVFALLHERARELWTDARALDGPLRITVLQSLGGAAGPYPWPSNLVLRDYFESDEGILMEAGGSKLVATSDAPPLRALREQFLQDTRPGYRYTGGGIPITDGETLATMFMRDALPYEDERGLWSLPEEPR